MNVINTEGFLGVSAEPRAAPDVLAAEAVETEAAAEPQSPEAPRDQVRAESAPVDDGSRERSSLAAVYNASTAHPSVSQQPQGIQDGITKRRAQLAAVAILLSIGFFLLMAKTGKKEIEANELVANNLIKAFAERLNDLKQTDTEALAAEIATLIKTRLDEKFAAAEEEIKRLQDRLEAKDFSGLIADLQASGQQ